MNESAPGSRLHRRTYRPLALIWVTSALAAFSAAFLIVDHTYLSARYPENADLFTPLFLCGVIIVILPTGWWPRITLESHHLAIRQFLVRTKRLPYTSISAVSTKPGSLGDWDIRLIVDGAEQTLPVLGTPYGLGRRYLCEAAEDIETARKDVGQG